MSPNQLEIVSFSEELLDEAAVLLAARHRSDGVVEPALPPHFEEVAEARTALQATLTLPDVRGVAALSAGRVVGYLLGVPELAPPASTQALIMPPRAAFFFYEGHVADPDVVDDVYPAMYEAVAQDWVQEGYLVHYIQTVVHDQRSLLVWFSLGFGQEQVRAVRDLRGPISGHTAPEPRSEPRGLVIRRAGPDDIDAAFLLSESIVRFHVGPPIFLPYPSECRAALFAHTDQLLTQDSSPCWLAFLADQPVGILVLAPPRAGIPMNTPGTSIFLQESFTAPAARGSGVGAALLDEALTWARDAGYEWCVLEWMSANRIAGRFWTRHGFRPISYRLCRRVDERILWAQGPGYVPQFREVP